MSYDHDIFISYKRESNWTHWTREHFTGLLQSYLQEDLGITPRIFLDERIEGNFGADWVNDLGIHHARSKAFVVLFSRDYLGSTWCLHELDLMLERAMAIQAVQGSPIRTIVPIIVHDGELVPEEFRRITAGDLKKFRIAWMNRDTIDYHEFSKKIKEISPRIAEAVKSAPDFDDAWLERSVRRFNEVYVAQNKGLEINPTKYKLKEMPKVKFPPRFL